MKENILLSENKKEQVFLDITKNLKEIIDENDSNTIWWKKNNMVYFKQDEKYKELWCDIKLVWSVFEKEFDMDYTEIQSFIKNMMEKHFKLGYLTPKYPYSIFSLPMKKHYKLGYLTHDR